jgi:hypothetical protein
MIETLISVPALGEAEDARRSTDERVRASVGYRVDAPEGHLGVVEEVRLAGIPPRPLVLVVRALNRRYLLPARRIARVLPDERRLLLWPDPGFSVRPRR